MLGHRHEMRAVLVAVTVLAMGACTAGNKPEAPATVGQPSPTSGSSPISATSRASQEAKALVRRYYATIDRLGQDMTAPSAELASVATSLQLAAEQRVLAAQRSAGERQVGNTVIAQLEVQSVNLNNSNPAIGDVPTVQIDVCWNVSGATVVNASGRPIVSPNRPDVGWTELTVANYHYASDPHDGWRVATGRDLKRTPCEPS